MAGRVRSMKNSIDTIGNRTSDLSACSTVPHTTILRSHNLVFVYSEVYFKILLHQQLCNDRATCFIS